MAGTRSIISVCLMITSTCALPPPSFDWNTQGFDGVGHSGFIEYDDFMGIIASVETAWWMDYGYQIKLSLQQMIDCVDREACREYFGGDCSLWGWLIDSSGLDGFCHDSSYPLNSREPGSCKPCEVVVPLSYDSISIEAVQSKSIDLQNAVSQQPILVYVNGAMPGFKDYHTPAAGEMGVLTVPPQSCNGRAIVKTMLVVGYGEYNGELYWKLQDTWGAVYGNSPMYLSRMAYDGCESFPWGEIVKLKASDLLV